jgi:hypothetical protein
MRLLFRSRSKYNIISVKELRLYKLYLFPAPACHRFIAAGEKWLVIIHRHGCTVS